MHRRFFLCLPLLCLYAVKTNNKSMYVVGIVLHDRFIAYAVAYVLFSMALVYIYVADSYIYILFHEFIQLFCVRFHINFRSMPAIYFFPHATDSAHILRYKHQGFTYKQSRYIYIYDKHIYICIVKSAGDFMFFFYHRIPI